MCGFDAGLVDGGEEVSDLSGDGLAGYAVCGAGACIWIVICERLDRESVDFGLVTMGAFEGIDRERDVEGHVDLTWIEIGVEIRDTDCFGRGVGCSHVGIYFAALHVLISLSELFSVPFCLQSQERRVR